MLLRPLSSHLALAVVALARVALASLSDRAMMSSSAASGAGSAESTQPRSARKLHALELFSGLPERYDALSASLSFGQDPRWRRALVDEIDPREGMRVLDVACGTGLVSEELRRRARVS